MDNKHNTEKKEFPESFGIIFERMGVPRMAGRIWGWLLVCDPPHQTAAELAQAVTASRGSISTMTRLLTQFGLIEQIGLPGQRNRLYRVKSGAFSELLKVRMSLITEVREMAERGLKLLKGEPLQARRRLQECRDFYAFFEKELPALVRKWEKQKERTKL
jgi:DNA-binding transcriptional regulator GbsR (MarR family)